MKDEISQKDLNSLTKALKIIEDNPEDLDVNIMKIIVEGQKIRERRENKIFLISSIFIITFVALSLSFLDIKVVVTLQAAATILLFLSMALGALVRTWRLHHE